MNFGIKFLSLIFKFFTKMSVAWFKPTNNVEKNNQNIVNIAKILVWIDFFQEQLHKIKNSLSTVVDIGEDEKNDLLNSQDSVYLNSKDKVKKTEEIVEVEKIIDKTIKTKSNVEKNVEMNDKNKKILKNGIKETKDSEYLENSAN